MKQPSIFNQVLALSVLVLIVALAFGAALTLALPAPDRGRVNIREMAWALERKPSSVIDLQTRGQPPEGRRSPLVETALARALGRSRAEVRVVWKDHPGAAEGRGQNVVLVDGRDILVSSDQASLAYGRDNELSDDTFLPLFVGAVRSPGGGWLVGIPHDPVRETWRMRIIAAFAMAGVVLAPLVWGMARRISGPVEKLAESADGARLGVADPIPVAGPKEVRTAATAINSMHARLYAQAADQLRMMAALAHDLRTPITAIRLRLERAPAKLRRCIEPDLSRMTALIDDSLSLAHVGVSEPAWMTVDLGELISICQRDRSERGQPVRLGETTTVDVETDPAMLQRALDNLVDNALRYGDIAVLSVTRGPGGAVLSVRDNGPGIPEAELARLLRPFEVLDPARSRALGGAGLGLSIVGDIAAKLGIGLTFSNRPAGLTVNLEFPSVPWPLERVGADINAISTGISRH